MDQGGPSFRNRFSRTLLPPSLNRPTASTYSRRVKTLIPARAKSAMHQAWGVLMIVLDQKRTNTYVYVPFGLFLVYETKQSSGYGSSTSSSCGRRGKIGNGTAASVAAVGDTRAMISVPFRSACPSSTSTLCTCTKFACVSPASPTR